MPILVLHGTEDTIPMAAAEEWVETLPNARLHPLSGVGHFPWVEDPGAFFPAARAFLASSGNAG
jgi:pimeloyl-ACP methyl ester carboxylesterase